MHAAREANTTVAPASFAAEEIGWAKAQGCRSMSAAGLYRQIMKHDLKAVADVAFP